jgi:hypothetical protein
MSYDSVWIQCGEIRDQFHERSEFEEEGLLAEFYAQCDHLYARGRFVVLRAGEDLRYDQLFLFEDASGAEAFYESGFWEWESFIGDDDRACGLEEVSLHWSGGQVLSKACAPSTRIEVGHE